MHTTLTASQQLHCSPNTVRRLLRTGRLPGFRLGNPYGAWRVTPEALESFIRGTETGDVHPCGAATC